MSNTIQYAVRRVRVGSTLRFGLVLGALLTLFPNLLLTWFLLQMVHSLRLLLESWLSINLFNAPVTNQPVQVDITTLLQLRAALDFLRAIDDQAVLIGIFLTFALTFLAGLLTAVAASFFGLLYNMLSSFSGGVVLELEEVNSNQRRLQSGSTFTTASSSERYNASRVSTRQRNSTDRRTGD